MQSVTFAGRCQLQQKIGSNIDQPFIKLASAPDTGLLQHLVKCCVAGSSAGSTSPLLGGNHTSAMGEGAEDLLEKAQQCQFNLNELWPLWVSYNHLAIPVTQPPTRRCKYSKANVHVSLARQPHRSPRAPCKWLPHLPRTPRPGGADPQPGARWADAAFLLLFQKLWCPPKPILAPALAEGPSQKRSV